jgi:hypothetical protein
MSTKQYHGSCMCGAVKYEANIDFSNGTGKCNCSTCTKLRLWFIRARPADFRLISGEDALTDYIHKSDWHHQLFCKHCGVHAFHRLNRPQIGGEWYSIAVNTLDDVEPTEMASWKVNYYDGRNDNYRNQPEHKEIY